LSLWQILRGRCCSGQQFQYNHRPMVPHQPCLFHQVMFSGQMVSIPKRHKKQKISHIFNPNGVIRHQCSRGAEQDDTTIRRVVHHVVTNEGGTAADADTVGPLQFFIRPTRANVIVLNDNIIAKKGTLGYVEARPTTRIIRMHVFDQLIRICATHLNICSTPGWRSSSTISIDLGMK